MYSLTSKKLIYLYSLYFFISAIEWLFFIIFILSFINQSIFTFSVFLICRLCLPEITKKIISKKNKYDSSNSFISLSLLGIIFCITAVYFNYVNLAIVSVFYIVLTIFQLTFWKVIQSNATNMNNEDLENWLTKVQQIGLFTGIIAAVFNLKISLQLIFIFCSVLLLVSLFVKYEVVLFEERPWKKVLHSIWLYKKERIYGFITILLILSALDFYLVYYYLNYIQMESNVFILYLLLSAITITLAEKFYNRFYQKQWLNYFVIIFLSSYLFVIVIQQPWSFLLFNLIITFCFVVLSIIIMVSMGTNIKKLKLIHAYQGVGALIGIILVYISIQIVDFLWAFLFILLACSVALLYLMNQKTRLFK